MTNLKLIFRYAFSDLKKQKIRTTLAIIGVLISIGLLTVVLFLSDSIAYSYVNYLTSESGNIDSVISVRHYNGEPEDRSSYFEFQPIIEKIENTTNAIKDFIPRMELTGTVKVSEGFNTSILTGETEWTTICGINFSLEQSINFGAFKVPDRNVLLDLNQLPMGHCAIYYRFNNIIKYSENDIIEIKMQLTHGNTTLYRTQNLTIDKIFDYSLKWPAEYQENHLIVVDIATLYSYFGDEELNGRCNKLILTFKNGDKLYDIRDIEGTERDIKKITGEIQLAIGLNAYNIDLPKLEILGYSEFLSVLIVVVFIFVSIVGMLISGVLINGILKTSVEERIREFGIFRTLGANKKYNLAIVLMQGFLLCNIGTITGIITANLVTRFIIIPFANRVIAESMIGFTSLTYSFTLWSILISYIMGLSVGMIVSISPALKVMRLQLIESIHPYRHEDTLYHLQKKTAVNYKLILVGIILAANGGFVFFVLPRILVSSDLTLFAGTLIAILLIFNIGLTLAGLGLMPLILRLVIAGFRPIARKLHNVIKIFVFRYQRRNSSTIIIFALSFSFVIFTSTVIQTLSAQTSALIRLSYGSDLVINTLGWQEPEEVYQTGFDGLEGSNLQMNEIYLQEGINDTNKLLKIQNYQSSVNPTNIMTAEIEEELLTIEGIEKISSVIAKPYQLTQIYSEGEDEFITEIGDYAGLNTLEITLIGIDEEYRYTVKSKYIEMTAGKIDKAFDDLFYHEDIYTCIISEAIAVELSLHYGDKIRIVVYRAEELEVYEFRIVGIAKKMPGFPMEFAATRQRALMGGVLISQETYIEIMDIPPVPYLDKIFIKLRENENYLRNSIISQINKNYQRAYNYEIIDLQKMVSQQQSSFFILDTLFTLIAMTTVFICIFGLLSSSYSTIIERTKEIGIIRTLGLKGKEINRLFVIEALIIMVSSGFIGVLIGWLTAWLVTSNLTLLIEMPEVLSFPWNNVIIIFSLSVLFIFIGMKILLRKLRKKKIVDIYRETM
jgi:ABC-type antimicrobial peptide transport system permease subunit